MKIRVISVKDNSVRVRSGIVTFDVIVMNEDGKLYIELPKGIYIFHTSDFDDLTGIVKSALNDTMENNHNERDIITEVC